MSSSSICGLKIPAVIDNIDKCDDSCCFVAVYSIERDVCGDDEAEEEG